MNYRLTRSSLIDDCNPNNTLIIKTNGLIEIFDFFKHKSKTRFELIGGSFKLIIDDIFDINKVYNNIKIIEPKLKNINLKLEYVDAVIRSYYTFIFNDETLKSVEEFENEEIENELINFNLEYIIIKTNTLELKIDKKNKSLKNILQSIINIF